MDENVNEDYNPDDFNVDFEAELDSAFDYLERLSDQDVDKGLDPFISDLTMDDIDEETGYEDDYEDEETYYDDINDIYNDDYDDIKTDNGKLRQRKKPTKEALSRIGRMKRARSAKRNRSKLTRKRNIAMQRRASSGVLAKRAKRYARAVVTAKLLRGRKKSDLSFAEKSRIETRLGKMSKVLSRFAQRGKAVVRKRETMRLSHA